MNTDTKTVQTRKAVYVEGVEKFELAIHVSEKGDLPTLAIFVVKIEDATDPKEDSFARVANIADLTTLKEVRTEAVSADEEYYRVSSYIFYYDDLDTAVAAADVLNSRIDELVTDWRTYDEDFEATSEETAHPSYDESTFEELVTAYETCLAAEETAKETRDEAKDDYDTAKTDADDAATALTDAKTARDKCYTFKGYFQALYDAMKTGTGFYQDAATFLAAVDVYYAATSAAYPTEAGVLNTARTIFTGKQATALSALGTATTNLSTFATECGDKDLAVTTAQNELEAAQTTQAQKRTAYEDAQAAYVAAQAASDAALTAIKALKPDYDPTTAS
jgi:hypothetical protein